MLRLNERPVNRVYNMHFNGVIPYASKRHEEWNWNRFLFLFCFVLSLRVQCTEHIVISSMRPSWLPNDANILHEFTEPVRLLTKTTDTISSFVNWSQRMHRRSVRSQLSLVNQAVSRFFFLCFPCQSINIDRHVRLHRGQLKLLLTFHYSYINFKSSHRKIEIAFNRWTAKWNVPSRCEKKKTSLCRNY